MLQEQQVGAQRGELKVELKEELKVELKEEPGHECVHCVLEASCDQRQWWPIHTFTPGAGEVAEFAR